MLVLVQVLQSASIVVVSVKQRQRAPQPTKRAVALMGMADGDYLIAPHLAVVHCTTVLSAVLIQDKVPRGDIHTDTWILT